LAVSDLALLAVTDNFWLVVAAVCGGAVTVVGTVSGTWLLSWLQEQSRYRHALWLVSTELADNASEVGRYEEKSLSMIKLRERLSTQFFEATRFELAPLQRRASGTWALLMDGYRRLKNTKETGSEPPSAEQLTDLFESLYNDHLYLPLKQKFKLWRAMRKAAVKSGSKKEARS
jgi:hypothetical protein